MSTKEIRRQVLAAAQAAEDKKAEDIRILELDPIDSGLADFFLIASASNDRQSVAIADEIEFRLKREFGLYANSVEGRRLGEWVLLDYVDFVVHVFLTERRAFYDIERLRKSARTLTSADLEEALKADLVEKTREARSKTPAKKAAPVKKTAAKKAPAKKAVAKKAPVKKAPVKKAAVKKTETKKAPAKKAVATKPVAKKAVAPKPTATKAVAKKPVAKKAPAKKAPAKKAAVKKTAAKKTAKK